MKQVILLLSFAFMGQVTQAHVNLLFPLGGEFFEPGQTINIEWEELVYHDTENYDLLYSIDGGLVWDTIQLDIPVSQVNYLWDVPNSPTSTAKIMVIQDNPGLDYNDVSEDFTIMGGVGLDETEIDAKFSVYPNPATDQINIMFDGSKSGNVELVLYDITGTKVSNTESFESYSHQHTVINTKDLPSNLYFIVVSNSEAVETRKIVIQH
jgi:hypothetical protein